MKRPSRPPAHTRYLSSPAEATLHGKTQGFVLRLPPQHKPHANSCNHYNAFRSITSQTCTYLRTWQHQMTTIMQPFHSDLQAQIQDTHRTMHTGTTTRCRTQRRNTFADETAQPPPRTHEVPFIAGRSHFTRKNHKVSCSGFLPNTSPMQHPCNHYNAFRSITSQTCTYLRTWQHQMTTIMQPFHSDLQAQIQDTHRTTHTGTTTRCRTQRRNTFADETAQPPPRTHEVPFIAGRSHFTRKNTRFRAPASSPTQAITSPMQHSCNHYNAYRSITSQTCTYLRTWQHQMTTIMQPFHSDLQAQIQDTHRTTHTGTTTRCRTQRRNTFAGETAQPPPRTHEVPFIAGRSHFTRKNARFAPASSPTQAPCNIHATITMRFAASRRKPARIYAHGNTR